MNTSIPFRWIGVFIYLMTLVGVSGQTTLSPQPAQQISPVSSTGSTMPSTPAQPISQAPTTLQAYQQELDALIQERQALMAKGATQEQLDAWHQQNAARFAAQQQRAQAMSAASVLQPMPQNTRPNIPANATQTLKDFLVTQAALANAHAQIQNQLIQSMPSNASVAQISQMEQQEIQAFQQQHAADLQLQTQRAQTLAQASAQTPLQPPPLQISPNTSPQLQAFLTTRYQLMRKQIELQNQYANAAPSVRQAAMQQWRQQNAGLIQQLQQEAKNLSQANLTTKN